MANTIAKATGGDATREKTTTRLGSRYASAQANTWRTITETTVFADGHGYWTLTRDGKEIARVRFTAEEPGAPAGMATLRDLTRTEIDVETAYDSSGRARFLPNGVPARIPCDCGECSQD